MKSICRFILCLFLLTVVNAYAGVMPIQKPALLELQRGEQDQPQSISASVLGIPAANDLRIAVTDDVYTMPEATALDEGTDLPAISEDEIKAKFKSIVENRNFLTALDGKEIKLPFGIANTVETGSDESKQYVICINKIYIKPQGTYADVFTVIHDIERKQDLAFSAEGIKLNSGGGFVDGGTLKLRSDYSIHFGKTTLTIKKDSSYVSFGCEGFKELGLCVTANVLDSEIETPQKKPVVVHFTTKVKDFENWLIEDLTIPAFQFKDFRGFTLSVTGLAFDNSSSDNLSSIKAPEGYEKSVKDPSWKGFYINKFTVTFPAEFRKMEADSTIVVTVDNALIDEMGFSGMVTATNLVKLDKGNLDQWQYSIEEFKILFVAGAMREFGGKGEIVVPVTEAYPMKYELFVQKGHKYLFSSTLPKNVTFDLWKARVELYHDSKLQVEFDSTKSKFKPLANLSGKFSIKGLGIGKKEDAGDDGGNSSVSLVELRFVGLIIKTEPDYVSLDSKNGALTLGAPGLDQVMAKLPLTIDEISLKTEKGRVGIGFTVKLNLVGNDQGGGFSAEGSFVVWGSNTTENRRLHWSYEELEPKHFAINNVRIAIVTLDGSVDFFRNAPVYGSGFMGQLKIGIDVSDKCNIGADVRAIFGKKRYDESNEKSEIYRYWAVDVLATFPKLPLVPGALFLTGIGGGVSNRMDVAERSKDDDEIDKAAKIKYVTQSGIKYVPDNRVGLGLRAMVCLEGPLPQVFAGYVAFGVTFNATDSHGRGGGVRRMTFNGYLEAMKGFVPSGEDMKGKLKGALSKLSGDSDQLDRKMEDLGPDDKSSQGIMLSWMADFYREYHRTDIKASFSVNFSPVFTGSGTVEMHSTPTAWSLYVGKPDVDHRIKLEGQIGYYNVKFQNYFAVGDSLTGISIGDYHPTKLDGFAMGVTTDIGFKGGGVFYYDVSVGIGVEVVLENVKGKVCAESRQPFGIKNWYAQGMVELRLHVEAGIEICIPYPSCDFLSCEIKEACAKESVSFDFKPRLYFKAPNPTRVSCPITAFGKTITVNIGNNCSY